MPIDHQDVAAWASRIRSHFPAHQQDTAEAAAFWIATSIGPKVRDLRPGTSMGTVLEWLKSARHGFKDPDWVELLMAIEAEVSSDVTDEFAESLELRTFEKYVSHLVAKKRPNTLFERTRGR